MRMLIAHRISQGNDKLHQPLNIDYQAMEGRNDEFLDKAEQVEAELRRLGNISKLSLPS